MSKHCNHDFETNEDSEYCHNECGVTRFEAICHQLVKYKKAYEILKETNDKNISLLWDHASGRRNFGQPRLVRTILEVTENATKKAEEILK